MRTILMAIAGAGAALLVPSASIADPGDREHELLGGMPPGHLPPPGECRNWIPGVPPGHQPPPTPCGNALGLPGYYGNALLGPAFGYDGRGGFEDSFEDRGRGNDRRRGRDDLDRDQLNGYNPYYAPFGERCDENDRRKGEC